jgi:predicted Zn finger-like uncharacterized protein
MVERPPFIVKDIPLYARARASGRPSMIVTCPSCQTRYRVPPEKIGPDGARIRCSRCHHVFAVRQSPPPLPQPAPVQPAASGQRAGLQQDPFGPAVAPPPDPFAIDLGTGPTGKSGPDLEALFATPPAQPSRAGSGGLVLEEREARKAPPFRPAVWGEIALDADGGDAPGLEALDTDPGGAGELSSAALDTPERPAPSPEPAPDPAPDPAAAVAVPVSGAAPERAPLTPFLAAGAAALEPSLPERRPPRVRGPPWVGGALSLAALVFAAAAFLAAWRGGAGERVASSIRREHAPLTIEPRRVTGGFYPVSGGARALVVRGEVAARSEVAGPVRVQVELRRGGRTLASAEAMAGAAATPEEVWAVAGSGEAGALRRALDARAANGLAPGGAAPFLVVFVPAPAEPGAAGEIELHVHAEPVPGDGH